MIALPLAGGHHAWVDREDFERFAHLPWRVAASRGKSYVVRSPQRRLDESGPNIRLHREIVGAKPGQVVDHIDGNPLNNCRSNLRICTQADNVKNRVKTLKPTSSRFKGVWLYGKNPNRPWRAQIKVAGRVQVLGHFATEQEAALAYDRAALAYNGQYARLNFPRGGAA